jgi:hypothetical protein
MVPLLKHGSRQKFLKGTLNVFMVYIRLKHILLPDVGENLLPGNTLERTMRPDGG